MDVHVVFHDFDLTRHLFAIVGGAETEKVFVPTNVYGTAISIGGSCLVTAGHVLQDAAVNPEVAIAFAAPDKNEWRVVRGVQYDVKAEYDIGFVRANVSLAQHWAWGGEQLAICQDVYSFGFPYALDRERVAIDLRGFKGQIVAQRRFPKLVGKPACYELSFACPRGLSGAPVLHGTDAARVHGIVIGNHTTEMPVFSDREVIVEGEKETIVERFEALNLGIALQTESLLDIDSTLLGGTLRSHLERNGLLSFAEQP